MGPIDYMAAMPQQDFLKDVMGGLQVGNQFHQMQLQQQQQQLAQDRLKQYNIDIQTAMAQPTPQAFSALALKYPEHREAFKQGWDTLNADQQQSELKDGAAIAASLHSNRPDLAIKQIQSRIDASKNSGQPTKVYEDLLQMVQTNPQQAYGHTLGVLAGIPGGDKILTNLGAIGTEQRAADNAPAILEKNKADASAAGSEAIIKGAQAGAAKTTVDLGIAKTIQEIAKSKSDARVAEFNAQIAGANSETERGRLTLERDKFIQEQAKLNQTQGVAAQDGMDSLNNALQSVTDIKNHRGMDAFFTGPGTKWGSIWRVVPGSDRQALETYIDTLKSQLGYGALMAAKASSPTGASGFGALSESELKVISQQAADLNPNSADFPAQLAKVERFLQKAQAKAVAAPSLPTKGGAYVATVPGIGVVDEGHINQVLKANPGATREQVIKYLQSVGGK